jgi:hypothetical protein
LSVIPATPYAVVIISYNKLFFKRRNGPPEGGPFAAHNHMMFPKARLVLRTARLPSRSNRFETSGYIELIAAAAKVAPATMPTLRPSVSVRIQFTPFRRIGLYVKAGAKHKAVCK